MAPPNSPSNAVTDKDRTDFAAHVRKVAAQLGMKVPPEAVVVDSKSTNAYYFGGSDQIKISNTALALLSPRELDAIIAHELGHREDWRANGEKFFTSGTNDAEGSADKHSVREWGDAEALKSGNDKLMANAYSFTNWEYIQDMKAWGIADLTAMYKHASRKKKQLIIDAVQGIEQDAEKRNPHHTDTRPQIIQTDQENPTPAIQKWTDWDKSLDTVTQAATNLTSRTSTPEQISANLQQILHAMGKDNIKFEPPPSREQAIALGEKLLKEAPLVREEHNGHGMNTLLDMTLGSGKEAPPAELLARLEKERKQSRLNDVRTDASILQTNLNIGGGSPELISKEVSYMLESLGMKDIQINPPLTVEEATKVAEKILTVVPRSENLSQIDPDQAIEKIQQILKNRGQDEPSSVISTDMRKALNQYQAPDEMLPRHISDFSITSRDSHPYSLATLISPDTIPKDTKSLIMDYTYQMHTMPDYLASYGKKEIPGKVK